MNDDTERDTAAELRDVSILWNIGRHIRNHVSAYGLAATILFGLIAIYLTLNSDKKPFLVFEVVSSNRVLEVREELPNLDILYNNESIQESGKMLTVMVVRIVNLGGEAITKFDFSDAEAVGFRVINGDVVASPRVVDASTAFLQRNASVMLDSSDYIIVQPVLLNAQAYFTIKLTILHDATVNPTVDKLTTGEIANARPIEVRTEPAREAADPTTVLPPFGASEWAYWAAIAIFMVFVMIFVKAMVRQARIAGMREANELAYGAVAASQKKNEKLRSNYMQLLQAFVLTQGENNPATRALRKEAEERLRKLLNGDEF